MAMCLTDPGNLLEIRPCYFSGAPCFKQDGEGVVIFPHGQMAIFQEEKRTHARAMVYVISRDSSRHQCRRVRSPRVSSLDRRNT